MMDLSGFLYRKQQFSNRAGHAVMVVILLPLLKKLSGGKKFYNLSSREMASDQKVTEQWIARMPQYPHVSKSLFCFERISKANTLSSSQIRTDWRGGEKKNQNRLSLSNTIKYHSFLSTQFKMPCEHTNRNKQESHYPALQALCASCFGVGVHCCKPQ